MGNTTQILSSQHPSCMLHWWVLVHSGHGFGGLRKAPFYIINTNHVHPNLRLCDLTSTNAPSIRTHYDSHKWALVTYILHNNHINANIVSRIHPIVHIACLHICILHTMDMGLELFGSSLKHFVLVSCVQFFHFLSNLVLLWWLKCSTSTTYMAFTKLQPMLQKLF
jgi:hypothetical protein